MWSIFWETRLPTSGSFPHVTLTKRAVFASSFNQGGFSPVKYIVEGFFELFAIFLELNPQGHPQNTSERYPGGVNISTSKFVFPVIALPFGKLAILKP